MHSIELEQQCSELGTSRPADFCGGEQRRCLPENCLESGGDEFYPLPATRTTTKICSSQTELCKTKPFVRPTTFNGSTSWEDYHAQFELVANLNSWDQQTKAIYLAVSLGGPAQENLGDLDKDQRSNDKVLVKALDNRFVTHSRKKMHRVFLTLEALRGGGVELTSPPSIFLALNFCSLNDCQMFCHNCSLFVNTSFDTN